MKLIWIALVFSPALVLFTSGCEKKSDTEEAVEEIGEAVEAVEDAVKNQE